MTNMSIQPLWLTYFIEILLVLEFQLTKTYFGTFSYKSHFRPQISSNAFVVIWKSPTKKLEVNYPPTLSTTWTWDIGSSVAHGSSSYYSWSILVQACSSSLESTIRLTLRTCGSIFFTSSFDWSESMCMLSLLSPGAFVSWPSYSRKLEAYSFVVLFGSHIWDASLEEKPNDIIKIPYMNGFGEALSYIPLYSYFLLYESSFSFLCLNPYLKIYFMKE